MLRRVHLREPTRPPYPPGSPRSVRQSSQSGGGHLSLSTPARTRSRFWRSFNRVGAKKLQNPNDVDVLIRLIHEAFGAGDLSFVDELMAPDVVEHQFGVQGRGPEAIAHVKAAILDLRRWLPDLTFTIEDTASVSPGPHGPGLARAAPMKARSWARSRPIGASRSTSST